MPRTRRRSLPNRCRQATVELLDQAWTQRNLVLVAANAEVANGLCNSCAVRGMSHDDLCVSATPGHLQARALIAESDAANVRSSQKGLCGAPLRCTGGSEPVLKVIAIGGMKAGNGGEGGAGPRSAS